MKKVLAKKGFPKKALAIIGSIFGVLLCLFLVYKFTLDPMRGAPNRMENTMGLDETLTAEEALEDIDYVMKIVSSRHPAWLEKTDASKAVDKAYLEERVKFQDGMTVLEEWQAIGRMLHELYDGHTGVYEKYDDNTYLNDFSDLQGDNKILAINDEPLEKIRERFLSVYQYEIPEFGENVFNRSVIVNETYLRLAGVDTSEGALYTIETPDEVTNIYYDFVPLSEVQGWENKESRGWVYYDIDEEASIGIFTLTSCKYNSEYRRTVKKFFQEVQAVGVENVIVDLRDNGGGSSLVADEFIHYLPCDSYQSWASANRYGNLLIPLQGMKHKNFHKKPIFDGKVYVLTNVDSYSSAMDFAMLIKDNHLGTIVGEPSGNMPNSYGQCVKFQMPNSKLCLSVSCKRWHRVDISKDNERIMPDYECKSRDAMDKAYELILEGK